MFLIIIEIVFWLSAFLVFYAYFGYPLILCLLSIFHSQKIKKGDITPSASFIITAYNEEKLIGQKIKNSLAQDYPRDRLEIIVASDCSSDKTDEIVATYESKGVKLVRSPERKGKENAQKCAVDVASGDIFIFSDVATILDIRGVSNIVKSFYDPTVGCVSSVDKFLDREGNVCGEGVYVKYEMILRQLETKVNTVVGLSGSFFAARRDVCRNWATDLQSDFNTLLNTVKMGLRGVSDPDSSGYYKNISNETEEFDRKVRTVLRGITVLMRNLAILNPLKYGLFSWQVFSHKLCRWLVPFWIILAFWTNLLLVSKSMFYFGLFIIQVCFFGFAFLHVYLNTFSMSRFGKIAGFFVVTNASICRAWLDYITGRRMVKWNPSKR
jgi:glycosyltransferase involved in cell wall biosynthesis